MISITRTTTGRVKHWHDGTMKKRWIAAGMLEAERSFRRLKDHADMPSFVAAVARATTPDDDDVTPTEYAQTA
jgi:putative transposase